MTRRRFETIGDLPDTIAIFPLPGALLFPGGLLPLNIFEPRYLNMIDDAMAGDRLIGMVQAIGGGPKHHPEIAAVGTLGEIVSHSETEDGRYLITLTGVSRYRILGEVSGFSPYRRCAVDWRGFERDLGRSEHDQGFERSDFLDLLGRFFASRGLSTDWDALQDADDELLINSLSMLLEFEPEDKQALLEAPSLVTRRETLVTLIEFALRGGTPEETLQ